MTYDIADLVSSVNQAQRRLLDAIPRSTEWRYAQQVAVHARADYWQAMQVAWDTEHAIATADVEQPTPATIGRPEPVHARMTAA
jgi:hypothetical protein